MIFNKLFQNKNACMEKIKRKEEETKKYQYSNFSLMMDLLIWNNEFKNSPYLILWYDLRHR